MFRSRMLRSFILTIVALVFATTAYALAASNTVPDHYAGEGAGTVSPYTVSNILYNLNAADSSNIDSVTFTLNAAAADGDVIVRLLTTGSYYTCTSTDSINWSCTTTGATIETTNEFRVIAGDSLFIP